MIGAARRDVPIVEGADRMSDTEKGSGRSGTLSIRAPQRFVAGVVLICLCVFVLWAVSSLSMGTVKFMGPALFPRVLAVMVGVSGVALIVLSLLRDGDALQKWSYRGPILVTVAIILFAVTVREFGLAVASFLALFVSGFATPDARPRETLIFAVALTIACVIVFRYLLDMAVPVLVIPGTSIEF